MYVFDNAADQTRTRFDTLEGIYDEGTIRHIEARRIDKGWSCLEVGGGAGSIATWLARRVGPTGRVVATDIDTRHLQTKGIANLEVRQHDVAIDLLPVATYDLVHARLVLMHLPERTAALKRMNAALKPGGWLVVEDFETGPRESATSPTLAAMRHVMELEGVDLQYGRSLPGELRSLKLDDVDAEGRTFLWRGGSLGAAMVRANCQQLRAAILDTGLVTTDQFNEDVARLANPAFAMRSPILWAAWGRRG